jgi:hypothetical protein
MTFMKALLLLFFSLYAIPIIAQKDTSFIAVGSLRYEISPIISNKHFGTQLGISRLLKLKEIHKVSQKIIRKERWIFLDLGFYSQPGLHNSLFLTGSYSLRRINPHGFYTQFRPFLGVAKTFLNEESYFVDANNNVKLNGLTGNFYLTGGFALDLGKVFSPEKSNYIRDIHAGFLLQSYYPNFGFIALRPAFQIGLSADIQAFNKKYKKIIIFK